MTERRCGCRRRIVLNCAKKKFVVTKRIETQLQAFMIKRWSVVNGHFGVVSVCAMADPGKSENASL